MCKLGLYLKSSSFKSLAKTQKKLFKKTFQPHPTGFEKDAIVKNKFSGEQGVVNKVMLHLSNRVVKLCK